MAFTLRLMESFEESRQVFSPLLDRFWRGQDYRTRPVKISDSGRIRNELQTWCSEALEFFDDDGIRLRLDQVDDAVMSPRKNVHPPGPHLVQAEPPHVVQVVGDLLKIWRWSFADGRCCTTGASAPAPTGNLGKEFSARRRPCGRCGGGAHTRREILRTVLGVFGRGWYELKSNKIQKLERLVRSSKASAFALSTIRPNVFDAAS